MKRSIKLLLIGVLCVVVVATLSACSWLFGNKDDDDDSELREQNMQFHIEYDFNGGEAVSGESYYSYASYSMYDDDLPEAHKDGYVYGGWEINGKVYFKYGGLWQSGLSDENTVTLVARWVTAEESLIYELDATADTYTVIGMTGDTDMAVTVPATYNGKPVTKIGAANGKGAFEGRSITGVTLPDTIEEIDERALWECNNLTEFTLPKNLKVFGGISTCFNITTVYWNATAVQSTYSLGLNVDKVTIADGVQSIPSNAFSYTRISEITIPESVKTVNMGAFYLCNQLRDVYWNAVDCEIVGTDKALFDVQIAKLIFGENVETVPSNLYCISSEYKGSLLEEITFGNKVKKIGDHVVYCMDGDKLANYFLNVSAITLPDTVTEVGNYAFYGVRGATVTMGDNVKHIGDGAFAYCNFNSNFTLPSALETVSSYAFYQCSIPSLAIHSNVKQIGESAFHSCGISHLEFAEGLQSLGAYAFFGNHIENNVVLPNSVTSIGEGVFYHGQFAEITMPFIGRTSIQPTSLSDMVGSNLAKKLTKVTVTNATEIPEQAFVGCNELAEVLFNSGVTAIGSRAFYGCSKITEFDIPSGVTTIGADAFFGCNLREITLPTTLQSVGQRAFINNSALRTIVLNAPNCQFESTNVFNGCNAVAQLVFGEQVRTLPQGIFDAMDRIIEVVTLSPTLTVSITDTTADLLVPHAIAVETSLVDSKLVRYNDFLWYVSGDNTLLHSYEGTDTAVTLPAAPNNAKYSVFYKAFFNSNVRSVTLSDNVASIGEYAFSGARIGTITMSDSVTTIEQYAFYGCNIMYNVTISDSVTRIGQYAFAECGDLATLTLGRGLTSIGQCAFKDCVKLQTINWNSEYCRLDYEPTSYETHPFYGCSVGVDATLVLGVGVHRIDDYAFYNYERLKTVEYTSVNALLLYYLGAHAFENTAITSFTVQGTLTTFGEDAFAGCDKLTAVVWNANINSDYMTKSSRFPSMGSMSVEVGFAVNSIPIYLFYNCKALTSIAYRQGVTGSVTTIGAYAFYGCSSLNSVTLPTVKKIEAHAFENAGKVANLMLINMPLQTIGEYAFANSGIVNVILPSTLTNIADNTFSGCDSIGSVTVYCQTLNSCFSGTGVQSVSITSSVENVVSYAFDGCTRLTQVDISSNSLTSFGDYVFNGCTSLTAVYLPQFSSVIVNAQSIFNGCTKLTQLIYQGRSSDWNNYMEQSMAWAQGSVVSEVYCRLDNQTVTVSQ